MKILIVYPRPDYDKHARFGFSYEMLTIATVLRSHHSVTIKDFSCQNYEVDVLVNEIEREGYELLLVECDSFALKRSENIRSAKEIIAACANKIPIIAYGNYCYITRAPFPQADYTIIHNDIDAILALVNTISGIQMPYISEYDRLPYIDRNLLMSIDYYRQRKKDTLLQTSKGCENTCVFCQRKGWQNHFVAHSDEYVLGELRVLQSQGYKNVWITDENFTFNLVRAKRLLYEIYERSLMEGMKFFISSWANIDREFLEIASKCNVCIISFGIESADPAILDFYQKNIDIENVPAIVRYANERGIFTVGNFILGAPMETDESIDKTFSLINLCEFDQVNIKNLDYMIGSKLYADLPDELRGADHVFASSENGLTSFALQDLVLRRDCFLKKYYQSHKKKLKDKILLHGTPY